MRFWVLFCLVFSMLFTGVSGLTPALGADEALLRGVVYDEGQKGLPGVAVSVWDGKLSYKAVTDFDGNFTIRGLLPGKPFAIRWTPRGGDSVKVDALTFPLEGDLHLSMDYGSVGRGTIYTVRLPSNPSTGYGWTALHQGVAVVRLKENTFHGEGDSFPERAKTGRPGTELWKYEGIAKGNTALIFGYQRPWEKGTTPVRYHVLSMTVR